MAKEKTIKILVVEDDATLLEGYRAVVAQEKRFEGRFTHDGSHAAALLRSEGFDAAIIDIKLPNMNGLQVAAVARSSTTNRRLPIFIVSGMLNDQNRARADSLGAITIIEKPFDPKDVVAAVLEACASQKKVSGYDVRIVNAIISSATQVLEFYYGVPVKIGKPGVRKLPMEKRAGVTGLIGIAGETFAGSLAMVSSQTFIESLAIKIFQTDEVKLDQEMIADLMGETCNQICGRLKMAFAALGIKSNIGLPEVVLGNDHVVVHKVSNPVLYVPVQVANVSCEVEFCLAERTGFVVDETKSEAPVTGMILFDD